MKLPYKSGAVTLTSKFGLRTLNGKLDNHKGIDLVGTDKTLVAPCDGVVAVSTMLSKATDTTRTWEWGNYIRIDTPDGLKVYMCHMAERLVKAGDKVKAGDVVGVEGNTGSVSPAPMNSQDKKSGRHLHFEIRKNGVSVNPCTYLGIQNSAATHPVDAAKKVYPDTYSHDGLTFERCGNFKIVYTDEAKKIYRYQNEASGGFFGNFKRNGVLYTLPVGNLVCDCIGKESSVSWADIKAKCKGGKLRLGTNDRYNEFTGKKVSTLIVPAVGTPYVDDVTVPPADCRYAISGVPTVRNGDDVMWHEYVKPQGWSDGCMYATYRNWLGVRDGEIWIISGKTTAKNYIYGMEFWKKVRSEGFNDIIALDGGGSFMHKVGTKKTLTAENRRINNKVVWS